MKALAVALALGLTLGAQADVSRDHAVSFQQKLGRIVQRAQSGGETQQTNVLQAEVNSYLAFSAGNQIPVGVTEPTIAIEGAGRLSGRAVVDLDVIRAKRSSGGWLDPTSYLRGKLPITASGVLTTERGRGRFALEQAAVGGVPIPKTFLQEIVTFYTRTSQTPQGIDIDAPFDLPAEIDRIDVQRGQALIVQ